MELDECGARGLGGGGVLGGGRGRGGVGVLGGCRVGRAQTLHLELEEMDLLVQVVDVRRLDLREGKVRCRAGGAAAKGRRAMIGVDSLGAVALPVRRGRALSSVICNRIGARASSRSSAPPFLADVERLAESLGSVRRTFGPCVPGPPPSGGEKTVIVCAGERGCACASGWRVR